MQSRSRKLRRNSDREETSAVRIPEFRDHGARGINRVWCVRMHVQQMRTLLNDRDQKEVLDRLSEVRPDSQRHWGSMSAHQTDSRQRVEMPIIKHLDPVVQKGVPAATRTGLFATPKFFVLRWSASIPSEAIS